MIGRGQSGLIVSAWSRSPARPGLTNGGFYASVGLADRDDYRQSFDVGLATARHDGEQSVYSVPYVLDGREGTVEFIVEDGAWTFRPDVGSVEGRWWHVDTRAEGEIEAEGQVVAPE